jgi:ribosomal protein L31
MAEATITCTTCDTHKTLHGTAWEVAVAIEVWQKEHERTVHNGETVSAWKIEPG